MISSAHDVARFFYSLLGPSPLIVSASSVRVMSSMRALDRGWEAGSIQYGYGLMIQNVSPDMQQLPPLSHPASYIGHGGDTFGFLSDSGFFPALNASLSVIVNEDSDFMYPTSVVTCKVAQIVAKAKGIPIDGFKCVPANPLRYICSKRFNRSMCVMSRRSNLSRSECEAHCRPENE